MNWKDQCRAIVTFLMVTAPFGASAAQPEQPATKLFWRNGEALDGELAEANAQEFSWRSPAFQEPLLLKWDVISRIDSAAKASQPAAPFGFSMRDGSFLYGDVTEITPELVIVSSPRHGEVRLKRSEIKRVRRTSIDRIAYIGPNGDAGWTKKSYGPDRGEFGANAVTSFVTGPGGSLHIPYWNVSVWREIALPEAMFIDVRLHSTAELNFRIDVLPKEKQRLCLETWGDSLVFTGADSFALIRKIPQDLRELFLRIAWDRKTGRCVAFDEKGQKLLEWQVPEDKAAGKPEKDGIFVLNKRKDLLIDRLEVRAWDGQVPKAIDLQQPRVELAGGDTISGKVKTAGNGVIVMETDGDGAERTLPFSDVIELVFATDKTSETALGPRLTYSDGTLLVGKVATLKEGVAQLSVPFAENILTSKVDGLRVLRLERDPERDKAAAKQLDGLDKLLVNDLTLHGKLTGGEATTPGWLPVGGVRPSSLSQKVQAEIQRYFPKNAEFPNAPALFYTKQGDVLPGALVSLSESGAEFRSAITEVQKLDAKEIEAIYFAAKDRQGVKGFSDPSWTILKGTEKTVVRTGDVIAMEPETSIGHATAMQAAEISLRVEIESFGAVRMRLFCGGTDPSKSTNLTVMKMGNRLTYGIEEGENQFEEQGQTQTLEQGPVAIRVVVSQNTVTLHLNDLEMRTYPIDPTARAGYGLILEPASMWGNQVQPIKLSAFTSQAEPGGAWSPTLNPESRLQALTIPRFRKENPPRHVLIAANGDLLRGEIEAITSTHFGFLSGLETLKIPRDRVKAAVWVKQPSDQPVDNLPSAARPKWMDQMLRSQARFGNTNLASLLNFLRNQVPEIKFRLPDQQANQRHSISFTQQTVGSALDQISATFNVRYTIDDTGTVIFEPGRGTSANMAEKMYWISSARLPKPESIQELFTSKGVLFPKEASVRWMPSRGQLVVINTPDNLLKLEQVLTTELGPDSYLSPTHWLQLANGGRLALKAETFDAEFVRGVHPIYGKCVIPITDVFAISNRSPVPTPAMRALSGWQLTFAPEPVIPETGGESSPILGTEAKPFKLALLGGGDFESAKEKGKVVVLDFWATWCGPCIKSLPGLIDSMLEFSPEQVTFIGVNQGEPADTVKRFLETRGWEMKVVLDSNQTVGRDYKVEGIPHTVVIGKDGKVAWIKTGYTPTAGKEIADAVRRLLQPTDVGAVQASAGAP